MSLYTFGFWCMLTLSCFALHSTVTGFSLNVNARIKFIPEYDKHDSYFGYSLLLNGGEKPSLLVGAPLPVPETDHAMPRSGAIYHCGIPSNGDLNAVCRYIAIHSNETRGAIGEDSSFSYEYQHDDMWLGMAMDGNANSKEPLVVCAPRWSNKYYKSASSYFANGMCYSVDNTGHSRPMMPMIERDMQTYTGIIPINKQEVDDEVAEVGLLPVDGNTTLEAETKFKNVRTEDPFLYHFGQAGMSVKFSQDGSQLIIGAPGVFDWTGTVINYPVKQQNELKTNYKIPNPVFTPQLQDYSYFGYSVDSGRFLSAGEAIQYVAGAPRGKQLHGQVLVFTFPERSEQSLVVISELLGHQMGEYFGAVVSAVDIDQDGLDDLLVGAPLYAQTLTADLGRVYVYINKDNGIFEEHKDVICGSCKTGARFGSSIAIIGDLNEDGYTDVAIGAPYEDGGRGAVYIYLGSRSGLSPKFSQRISLSPWDHSLGFGISISKGVDIDNNSCNDIAVGAYERSFAVLLRSHPSMSVNVKFSPPEIPLDAHNITIQSCFTFSGSNSSSLPIQELLVNLTVDPVYKRANLYKAEDRFFTISETKRCINSFIVILKPNATDFSRPVDLKMEYTLKKNPMDDPSFCKHCRVLREKETVVRIPFKSDCGEDFICRPDLKLDMVALQSSPYVIGSANHLSVKFILSNTGEHAYIPNMVIKVPAKTPLLRIPPACKLKEDSLSCQLVGPISNNTKGMVAVDFDTSQLTNLDTEIHFDVTASSAGEDLTPKDNHVVFTVPLKTIAKLKVIGKSPGDYFLENNIGNKTMKKVQQTIVIVNEGYTELSSFVVKFYIPVAIMDETTRKNYTLAMLYKPKVPNSLHCELVTGSYYDQEEHNSTHSNKTEAADNETLPLTSWINNKYFGFPQNKDSAFTVPRKLQEDSSIKKQHLTVNCSDVGSSSGVSCAVMHCSGRNMKANASGAILDLEMILHLRNIESIVLQERGLMLSTLVIADVAETQSDWHTAGYSGFVVWGAAERPKPSIWLLLLSLVLGFAILAGISYALHRKDFFKRQKREELNTLRNEDSPANITDDDPSSDNLI